MDCLRRTHGVATLPRRARRGLLSVWLWGAWFASEPFWSGLAEVPAQDRVPGDALLEIGVLMGDRSRMFGRVNQLAVDSNGNIVVLDSQNYSVSWFAPDGRHIAATGRQGGGPAEFQGPASITVGPDDSVFVLDAPTRRVIVFALSSGEPTILRTIRVPVFAEDICIASDGSDARMVLLGRVLPVPSESPLIHVLSLDGNLMASFGSPLEDASRMEYRNNRGHLACTSRHVSITSERLGVVRAYSLAGEPIQTIEIDDFAPVQWIVDGTMVSMGMDPKLGRANTITAIAPLGPASVVLTVHEASATDWDGHYTLLTADLETGETSSPHAQGLIAAKIVDDRMYGYVNNPFPKVVVRNLPQWMVVALR